MNSFINTDVFISRLLYFIKLAIFANKSTDDDETLNKCVALYNKIKKIDFKDERTEEDDNTIRRFIKILNLSLKVDANGVLVNIGDKQMQTQILKLKAHPAIESKDLGAMKRFLKEKDIALFYGIPLSFFLKKCKHDSVAWQYLLICYHITQILVAELSEDSVAPEIIQTSLDDLEVCLIDSSKNPVTNTVNKLMSKDVYLNNVLLKPNSAAMIQESVVEVKKILSDRGISEESALFKLVDKISDKLEGIDQDGSNIFTKLGSIIGELSLEMRCQMPSGSTTDIKSDIQNIIEIFKEVTSNDKNMEKIPKESRAMIDKIMKVIPTDPNEKMSEEKAQELQQMFGSDLNDISKNMARASGADPVAIQEIEKMLQQSTPKQISKALKFKL